MRFSKSSQEKKPNKKPNKERQKSIDSWRMEGNVVPIILNKSMNRSAKYGVGGFDGKIF